MSNASLLRFFVYGTLMSGQPNDGLWRDAVVSRQPARFPNGALYDFGAFPMLVEEDAGVALGELVQVMPARYEGVIRRLDKLEEFDPQAPEPGPYRRVRRNVLLGGGRNVESWVYLGDARFVAGRPRVLEGDWRSHTELWREKLASLWQQRRQLEQGLMGGDDE